ncbi:hypothetical protein BV20DRAFT_7359 [Pilatotrama ljubarskyi]|nr:hypothetical protein BV20DRAFT_7359 [Pilatotrama ljubarskyi]
MAVDRAKLAAAAQRNLQHLRQTDPSRLLYTDFDPEHDDRQRFRKRIDRDIIAANSLGVALQSLRTVLKLAENILAEPTNERFRRFRITNDTVRRSIMEPRGVLQLVVDLGFREKAENYNPCYVFNAKAMNQLRIGASMIKEALARESLREDESEKIAREHAERQEAWQRARLQIQDDRKSVAARAQRERRSAYQKGALPARSSPKEGA